MLHSSAFQLISRILLIIISLLSFSVSVLPQGYVVEMHGTWRKSNGTLVRNRQKISAETRLSNVSDQSDDSIFIADANSKIVVYCLGGCKSLIVPNTQSWGEYLWCKIVGCNSLKYITAATKGDECVNFDGIAVVDKNGITDLSEFLKLFANRSDTLSLKFQRKAGDSIEENQYEINTSNPQVKDLQFGNYDVLEGAFTSRVLILPAEIYEEEKPSFAEIQSNITYWKEKGLSSCTIKTFTQSYLDYVAKKYKSKLKKDKRKIEAKP